MKKPLLYTVLKQYLEVGMISNTQLKHINRWLKTIFKDVRVFINEEYLISVQCDGEIQSFDDPEQFVNFITEKIKKYNTEHGIKNTDSIYTEINGVKKQIPNIRNILRKSGA